MVPIFERIWPLSVILFTIRQHLGLNVFEVEKTNLSGKVCIVTGGARGIGKEVSKFFSDSGATVIIADKSEANGLATTLKINLERKQDTAGYVRYMHLDLAVEDSIRDFVSRFS